jgi:signal transduction histidine kinase
MAQEALNNVAQHAQASHVFVRLAVTPGDASLRVTDDGAGFELAQVPPGRFGLIGLNERARLLGGQLSLQTSLGAGTCVEVVVPLEPP